jgi:anti-sigma factor RsiW
VSRQEPCSAWIENISAYLDGALAGAEEQLVHAHLRACAACAEFLVDLVPVVQALQALPAPVPTSDPWPAIAFALRTEGHFRPRGAILRLAPRQMGWVAAGVLFLATGSMAFLGYQQSAAVPTADVDMYWSQHEMFSHEDGMPSNYAPEFNAIQANYHIEP